MTLFHINEELCKKDGICATECPFMIIDFQDNNKFPQPFEHSEAVCINCGHCVAVCPHGAFNHKNLSPEDCLPADKKLLPDAETTEHFLRYRRSIRNYKDKPIEKEKIEQLIHIASHAPSGHNRQPVVWQVINGKEKVKELSSLAIDWMKHVIETQPGRAKMLHLEQITAAWEMGLDVISRKAPALVLVNGGKNDPFADSACKIAMTYFDIAAPSLDLGTCWNGYFNMAATAWKPLQDALGFEESLTNFGTMMLGYPKFRYKRMPTRNTPQVTWIE